jgi:transcription antitermination factor NusG
MNLDSSEKKKWYAIYTRPRWEKKVHQLLVDKGIESYCPLNKVKRQWSDRVKKIDEPLFKSYVFVRVLEEEKTRVRMTNGVVNFIYWLGKPAVITNKDIEIIQRFLGDYEEVELEALELSPQDKVKVKLGVFTNEVAEVLKVGKKKVEVRIESLRYKLVAWVEKNKLELIK